MQRILILLADILACGRLVLVVGWARERKGIQNSMEIAFGGIAGFDSLESTSEISLNHA